jgi:16S rRNA processing protein RimM
VTDASTPSAPEPERPADAVEVGRVTGAWGIQGGIKVKPFAADPQALFSTKRWFIEPPALGRPGVVLPTVLRVISARGQGEFIVATAQELPDRTAAEALKGARILVSRASFPTPDSDEFYWIDLIGCQVFDRAARCLGTVDHLIETGPHCVLVIRPEAGEAADAPEVLIPFVAAYVDRVDTAARRIDVDWSEDFA